MEIILAAAFMVVVLYIGSGPLWGSAALDDSIPTIVSASTLGRLKENAVMSMLVRRDFDDEVGEFGDTIQISKRKALAAPIDVHSGTIGIPADSNLSGFVQVGDDPVSIVLNQHKGVNFKIGSFTRVVSRPDQLAGFTMDAGRGLAADIDSTLLVEVEDNSAAANQFQSASNGTNVAVSDLIKMDRLLNESLAPMMDRYAVWHPRAKASLIAKGIFIGHEVTSNVAVSVQDGDPTVRGALMDSALGRRLGFDHFMDQNVGFVGTLTADSQANIFFAKEGVVLASRPLDRPPAGAGAVSNFMVEDGLALRVTMQWNIREGNVMDVLVDYLWGVKIIRPEFGGRVQTDLTA